MYTTPYVYSPLKDKNAGIRVLLVHAGHESSPIHATLQHISLRNPPEYETISYVWGDPKERATIIVDGKTLDVPASAERAIRRVRKDVNRTIWIDAICINQADLKERAQQVAIMGEVYSKTAGNLVWLGKSQESTAAAVDVINAMWIDILCASDNLITFYESTREPEFNRYSELHKISPHDAAPLMTFFSNPWFQRLWCVQEVVLSASGTIICGEFELPLLKVLRVAQWCWHKAKFLNPPNPLDPSVSYSAVDKAFKGPRMLFNLVDIEHGDVGRRRSRGDKLYIFELLDYSMQFETTEPRDKVFAILGLIPKSMWENGEFSALIRPDYQKPVAYVFRDAIKAAILELGKAVILRNVFHHGAADPGGVEFPSWVPRLHEKWDWSTDAGPFIFQPFMAYPEDPVRVESFFTTNPDILCLRGMVVDSISDTSPVFSDAVLDSVNDMTTQLRMVNGMLGVGNSKDPQPLVESLARTLIATNTPDDTDHIYQTFLGWAMTITHHAPSFFRHLWTDDVTGQRMLKEETGYNDGVIESCTNRRFFCTQRGFVGLGPREVSVADVVVVVYGYPLPLILRRIGALGYYVVGVQGIGIGYQYSQTDGMPDHYCLVGECYVDGIMHGEAVAAHQARGGKDRVFRVV
jgi:hypothetical protein